MPYANSFLDDENDPSKAPQLAGGSEIFGGGTLNQSTGGNAKGPGSSDQYQNLNAYLDANKDSTFGQDFVGKVQNETTEANKTLNNSVSGFKQKADEASTQYDPNLVNSAISDPTSFVSDQGNVDKFKKQKDASYQGPNSLADAGNLYGQAYGQTRKAADTAEAAGTEGGRFALLGNYFGRPDYKQGEKSLDNLLIQGNPQTQQGIAQAKANAQVAAQNFNQESQNLSGYAGQKRGETEKARNSTRAALGVDDSGNVLQPTTGYDGKQVKPKGAIQDVFDMLDADVDNAKKNTKMPTSLQGLGVDPNSDPNFGDYAITNPLVDHGRIPGFNPIVPTGNYQILNRGETFSTGPNGVDPFSPNYYHAANLGDANRGNAATADHAARLRALQQLAETQPLVGNLDEAGKYTNGVPNDFNKDLYMTEIGNRREGYKKDAQAAMDRAYAGYQAETDAAKKRGGSATPLDFTDKYRQQFESELAKLKTKYGAK